MGYFSLRPTKLVNIKNCVLSLDSKLGNISYWAQSFSKSIEFDTYRQ